MSRQSQRLGKRGEYSVIGKLLEMNCDVYVPIVDVENIDCIIRDEKGEYNEIQIKTRTMPEDKSYKNPCFDVHTMKPRKNFYVIGHIDGTLDYWVIPSRIYLKSATTVRFKGKIISRLTMSDKKMFDLRKYKNNFEQLKK